MSRQICSRVALTAGALVMAGTPVLGSAALAQSTTTTTTTTTTRSTSTTYGDSYGNYGGYASQGGDYRNPTPPPEPVAPEGYDGTRLPPAPQGYVPPADQADMRAADERYAADAQRWAAENCVKSHGDTATGALVGGILGAIVGGSLAGRHDRGAGVFAGAAVGAVGGAAVASSSGGDTSPGCPPGYVVRRDAVAYSYGGPSYYYAAPGWYRPWVFVGGSWAYRPYPYHDWYWRTYRDHRGPYGRPGPRGDWHGPRGDGPRGDGPRGDERGDWHGDHWRH